MRFRHRTCLHRGKAQKTGIQNGSAGRSSRRPGVHHKIEVLVAISAQYGPEGAPKVVPTVNAASVMVIDARSGRNHL